MERGGDFETDIKKCTERRVRYEVYLGKVTKLNSFSYLSLRFSIC